MTMSLEKYLNAVNRRLKPLPISERADIIKEIEGSILEMEQDGLSREQIAERLGTPKDLAKAYLADLLAANQKVRPSRILAVCAFYGTAGFSGLFIIPVLGIIAPCFLLFGILSPLAGTVKLIDSSFGLNLPFTRYIIFTFGSATLSPIPAFFASIGLGAALSLIGYGAWRLLALYCRKVGSAKRKWL